MTNHQLRTVKRQSRQASRSRRRGSVFPIFVVALLLLTTITGSMIKATLLQRKRVVSSAIAVQADWIASSGLNRCEAQLTQSADYVGEKWKIPATEIDGKHSAEVTLTVESIPDLNEKKITAVVRFGTDEDLRAQVTRSRKIKLN